MRSFAKMTTIALLAGSLAATPFSAESALPVGLAPIASGMLYDSTGVPVSGAQVTLFALREQPDGAEWADPIGSATSATNGAWAVDSPATNISLPRAMEIQASKGSLSVIYDYGQGAQGANTAPRTYIELMEGVGAIPPGSNVAGVSAAVASGPTVTSDDGSTSTLSDQLVESAIDSTGPSYVPGEQLVAGIYWIPQNQYKDVWDPLKVSKTLGKSTLKYEYRTTNRTQLGVAIKVNGTWADGGLSYSKENSSGLTLTPKWEVNTSKMVKMKWKYRLYRACKAAGRGRCDGWTNNYKWLPYSSYVFTKPVANDPTFSCAMTGPIGSETKMEGGVTVGWKDWFSVVGVTLDSTQTQSTQTALTIIPEPRKTPRYCFSTTTASASGFIREIN